MQGASGTQSEEGDEEQREEGPDADVHARDDMGLGGSEGGEDVPEWQRQAQT